MLVIFGSVRLRVRTIERIKPGQRKTLDSDSHCGTVRYSKTFNLRGLTMDPITLIIQALSGAAGGNVLGNVMKNLSLGTVGNSLAGIIGGLLGGNVLGGLIGPGATAAASGSLDLSAIIGQVVSGGAGGGILMAVVGLIRSVMAK